jgi:ribosome-associated protein
MSDTIIQVKRYPIRLGQFLKLADAVQDGVEAKIEIGTGQVSVNGVVENRRGRQLKAGDQVSYRGQNYVCR